MLAFGGYPSDKQSWVSCSRWDYITVLLLFPQGVKMSPSWGLPRSQKALKESQTDSQSDILPRSGQVRRKEGSNERSHFDFIVKSLFWLNDLASEWERARGPSSSSSWHFNFGCACLLKWATHKTLATSLLLLKSSIHFMCAALDYGNKRCKIRKRLALFLGQEGEATKFQSPIYSRDLWYPCE